MEALGQEVAHKPDLVEYQRMRELASKNTKLEVAQKVAQKEDTKLDVIPSQNINYLELKEWHINEPKFLSKLMQKLEPDIQRLIDNSIEAAKRGEY